MSDMYFQNLPSTSTPITAENLNKLNDIKVSSTEPITGEKMWIQKGKNLLDKNNKLAFGTIPLNSTSETLDYNTQSYTTDWMPCTPNTKYTVSGGNRIRWQFKNASETITYADTATATSPIDAKYMRCYCYYDENNTGLNNVNLQIEQGATATSYEAYIEPTLYVKNNNGVYEKQFTKSILNRRCLVLSNYFDTVDINDVLKIGNIVQVVFRAHTKTAIPNDTVFATLPYQTKSNNVVALSTMGRYSFGDFIFSYTGASGGNYWKCGAISADKWVQANFVYITSD